MSGQQTVRVSLNRVSPRFVVSSVCVSFSRDLEYMGLSDSVPSFYRDAKYTCAFMHILSLPLHCVLYQLISLIYKVSIILSVTV